MGGDRLEAVGIALQVGPVPGLAEIQEPGGSRGQKRSPSGAEGSPGACQMVGPRTRPGKPLSANTFPRTALSVRRPTKN